MTRDHVDRLALFLGKHGAEVTRLALNFDQVQRHRPPPNPTKVTDSRAVGYIRKHGHECWELDALSPRLIGELVRREILTHRDPAAFAQAQARHQAEQAKLDALHATDRAALKRSPELFELAERHCRIWAAAACVQLWARSGAILGPFIEEGAWLAFGMQRLLKPLRAPQPPGRHPALAPAAEELVRRVRSSFSAGTP